MGDSYENRPDPFDPRIGVEQGEWRSAAKARDVGLQPVFRCLVIVKHLTQLIQELADAHEAIGLCEPERAFLLAEATPVPIGNSEQVGKSCRWDVPSLHQGHSLFDRHARPSRGVRLEKRLRHGGGR